MIISKILAGRSLLWWTVHIIEQPVHSTGGRLELNRIKISGGVSPAD